MKKVKQMIKSNEQKNSILHLITISTVKHTKQLLVKTRITLFVYHMNSLKLLTEKAIGISSAELMEKSHVRFQHVVYGTQFAMLHGIVQTLVFNLTPQLTIGTHVQIVGVSMHQIHVANTCSSMILRVTLLL